MSACSNQSLPPTPDDPNCDDWDWDNELGVWECDDYDSDYRGAYFYGGRYFKGKSSLLQSSKYKSYKSSSSFKGGFGSGSKGGFGG
ncbi:hypothetical protein EJF36_09910 [Bacillus sp. HMF5848]|uniref:hypothetical protein n=1 Tax=Bacillus sp. HMF5848 TaxID=2495421 RepID=UPI000F78EB91|nr:hypothetical protein [Bacillus sp. HMF5848]RSK29322.1 hypothetical protein EJF36_09910 [Bacillus sp. HMF5848]